MIPSLVVPEIRSALVEFLSSTFALSDDGVRDELSRFLTGDDGIFRGPFLRVRTPLRAVDPATWRSPLDWLPADFVPYQHQATAFERLSSAAGHSAAPTLVTTGTGSGKTECFLYPILDHCARERAAGKSGVKALILYPMNALASDQAGRLAELIHGDARLAGVTAGLYVGDEGRHSSMTPDSLIDKREVLRTDPPDILLTNYKMLDFLLLRREDRNLWAENAPDTLRYIVLDEFHTYDGAQGTDVAMLLRRVGRALGMQQPGRPLGSAVPVATSATLGSGPGAVDDLCSFAGKVFGVIFGQESVVGETRQTVEEACIDLDFLLPIPDVDELGYVGDDVDAIASAFCRREQLDSEPADVGDLGDVVEIGSRLLAHPLTRAVLAAVGDRTRSWPEALAEINTRANNWGRASLRNPAGVELALARYLWLLSLARRRQGTRLRPLFSVEVQLWVREVSRLLRTVSTAPSFRWLDSAAAAPDDDGPVVFEGGELPAIYCRNCGLSGWMAVQSELGDTLLTNTNTIYEAALNRRPTVRALIAANEGEPDVRWYEPSSRRVSSEPTEGAVPVLITPTEDEARSQSCPACRERDTIRFLGLQVASLASVAVSTLFGSLHLDENERKLLAFTDSVQDASHRASFFSGRTHRFNLRTQMASVAEHYGSISLHDLGDEVLANATNPRDRFALVPPDLLNHPTVRTVWTDHPDPAGLDLLRRRLGFEADLEFGLRAHVGRTLELSRVAVASVEVPEFDLIADLVTEDLRRVHGDVSPETLLAIDAYLRGLLERLRLRGGIRHPLLDPYVNDGGRQWFVWGGRPDGLPPFASGQSRPLFFTNATKGDLDSLSALSKTPTWVVDWAIRVLGVDPKTARDLNLNAMSLLASQSDAVLEVSSPGGTIWGLNRQAIQIWDVADTDDDELTVAAVRCGSCGARHPVPPERVDDWYGTRCLRYRCPGRFDTDEPRTANYYRTLYRSGVTRRVVAAEHTGMLDRKRREDLEKAFKDGTAPDAPNVITATPTLEMGIDIGDLSAVMLTSVPRNPASYIQRVGRAGRLSGNALITTFVRTDTHGLYYLSEPEAMIAGEVRPPNCYLDAVETLQRQYIAYLFDRMADLTIPGDPLPREIYPLMKAGVDDGSVLRRVIEASILDPTHVTSFVALFEGHLDATTVAKLRDFAASGIETLIKTAITRWTDLDRDLGLRRNRLTTAIDKLEAIPSRSPEEDEQLGGLRGQRAAVIALLRRHRNEYVLSALEGLGLLPNYLLLGDTAMLSATLWSKDDAGGFHTETVEYTRSAHLALSEFAPGNSFYAGGHRHRIDALEIGAADEPLYEAWRLCPECGYGTIEPEGQPPQTCPRCGGIGIGDTGSRHTLLRLRTALASSSEEGARVYDESDERHREHYDVITTIDADTAHITGAWQLKDKAFGAELSGVTHLRTLNLGFSERRGERLPIAGADRHVTRFEVCRHCGAAKDVRDDRNGAHPERLHQGWCKVRSGAVGQLWDRVVLLHELTTEAVRFLLPISMFEVDERLASFKGALLLGLREEFGGNPDHLQVVRADMPNRGGQGRRHFLVVYDRVPGGTGYLARLSDPERVRSILEAGRRIVSTCPCRLEGRHACHRCLLGVVDRREYELARRSLALDILDDLLADWDAESIPTIAGIDIGKVEESELERRFKVAIRNWADHRENDDVTYTPVPGHNGRDAFELHITYNGQTVRYRIDEQEGISTTPSTLPDFLIRRQDDKAPDIAVYLDGYQFHASPEINNLAGDAAKREGVRASGRLVWNLTWDDVAAFHKSVQGETLRPAPTRPLLVGSPRLNAMRVHNARHGEFDFDTISQNPMALLLDYLRRPDSAQWERLALSAIAGAFSDGDGQHTIAADDLPDVVAGAVRRRDVGWPSPTEHPRAIAARWTTAYHHQLLLLLDAAEPNAERWTIVSSIADGPADVIAEGNVERWRDWLQWANLLQFVSGSGRDAVICASSQGDALSLDNLWLLAGLVAPAGAAVPAGVATPEQPVAVFALNETQEEELDLIVGDDIRELVRTALQAGVPDFIAGAEFEGESLEASWPARRVGVARQDQTVSIDGWDIRRASAWNVADLVAALEGIS